MSLTGGKIIFTSSARNAIRFQLDLCPNRLSHLTCVLVLFVSELCHLTYAKSNGFHILSDC